MSGEEADVSFIQKEILDMLACIEARVYKSEFMGIVMCLLDALSELCEVKDIKVLTGIEHNVRLHLQEEEIRMMDLTAQQTQVLEEIGPLVRDANELMAQMEVLKERYNKVMNCLKSHKRFVNHMGNSIRRAIYMDIIRV